MKAQWARSTACVAAAILLVAAAARLSFPIPGASVPQSAQTAAVLLAGGVLSIRLSTVAMILYVVLGGLGLPVLADGHSGWEAVTGPSLGYLVGFVVAAAWMSRAVPGATAKPRRVLPYLLMAAVFGHLLILGLGWLRLVPLTDAREAFEQGVAPFLWGGAVKSLVVALALWGAHRVGALPVHADRLD